MRFRKKHSSKERTTATQKDLGKMERRLSQQRSSEGGVARGTGKAIRMMGRGISNIGKSLSSPSDRRRPRIAQMPGSRHEIGISQHANSNKLKAPGLRNKDISGRRRTK